MATYTQLLYHIVFATKHRRYVIDKDRKHLLLAYMIGIIQNLDSVPYQINGVGDHIHILVRIHPSISVSDFIKTLKTSTTTWIKREKLFPYFTSWQRGYGAFSCSIRQKDKLIRYIENQEEHHQKKTFLKEYKKLLKQAKIPFSESYLE